MEAQSYYKGLNSGVSDGTLGGDRGVQKNYRRKANVQHEANKLGENLSRGVAALFLHPVFCFAGFWLIGFGSLLALAPAARATAPRTPSVAEVQQLLIEAVSPEITSTPPSEGPENEIGNAYCKELPDFCP